MYFTFHNIYIWLGIFNNLKHITWDYFNDTYNSNRKIINAWIPLTNEIKDKNNSINIYFYCLYDVI